MGLPHDPRKRTEADPDPLRPESLCRVLTGLALHHGPYKPHKFSGYSGKGHLTKFAFHYQSPIALMKAVKALCCNLGAICIHLSQILLHYGGDYGFFGIVLHRLNNLGAASSISCFGYWPSLAPITR